MMVSEMELEMPFNFENRVVIITGGASGIGEGMVRRFQIAGAKIILTDINAIDGERIAGQCGATFFEHDVSSQEGWEELTKKVEADYGRLDALLNNAGIVSNLDITQVDLAGWNKILEVNITGMMLGCQAAIALMRENPGGSGGSIVNTASSTSYLAIPDVAYTTSKSAVVGLTKSVAIFCANEGLNIRCNSLHPGATLTKITKTAIEKNPALESALNRMSPLGRMGTLEEVAAMAMFLASDESSFCTGGQFPVEGGTVSEHPKM